MHKKTLTEIAHTSVATKIARSEPIQKESSVNQYSGFIRSLINNTPVSGSSQKTENVFEKIDVEYTKNISIIKKLAGL